MKKGLSIILALMLGSVGAYALGSDTNAGTVIENNATLSYSAGGVPQPSITSNVDSFTVDLKVDMVLVTNDTQHLEVTPGQEDQVRSFTFVNESNSNDMNFTFTAYNLNPGEKADYNTTADNTDSSQGVKNIEITCTDGTNTYTNSSDPDKVTITGIAEDAEINCTVSSDIRTLAEGAADGQVMVIELNATAVDGSGQKLDESTGADNQSGMDIVFADGEIVKTDATSGLGETGGGNGDVAGNGEDVARSGYIISTPVLSVKKSSCVIDDPVNGSIVNGNNPKRIPGATIRYLFDINNTGTGDVNDLNLTDTFDDNLLIDASANSVYEFRKDENQSSCTCDADISGKTDIKDDTTVSGQDMTIEHINVEHGSTSSASGEKHTCVWVEVEIE